MNKIKYILPLGMLFFLFPPLTSQAQEATMTDLVTPSTMEPVSMKFITGHRWRTIGAHSYIGLQVAVWNRFQVISSFSFWNHELTVGASYSLNIPKIFLRAQLNAEFVAALVRPHPDDVDRWEKGISHLYFLASFQNMPLKQKILDRFFLTANFSFDGFTLMPGMGFGLRVVAVNKWFWVFKKVNVLLEFYPSFKGLTPGGSEMTEVLDRHIGRNNTYALGIQLQTYHHDFTLTIGNNREMGARQLARGVNNLEGGDLFAFGFNFSVLLEF